MLDLHSLLSISATTTRLLSSSLYVVCPFCASVAHGDLSGPQHKAAILSFTSNFSSFIANEDTLLAL